MQIPRIGGVYSADSKPTQGSKAHLVARTRRIYCRLRTVLHQRQHSKSFSTVITNENCVSQSLTHLSYF